MTVADISGVVTMIAFIIKVELEKNPTPIFCYAILELVTAKNICESVTTLINSIADTQRE